MTRGAGLLILPDVVFSTAEFNGAMDPAHHGRTFFNDLRAVRTKKEMERLQAYWAQIFDYGQTTIVDVTNEVDMAEQHLSLTPYEWFSDWLYVVNRSTTEFLVLTKERDITIYHNEAYAFNFGRIPEEHELEILGLGNTLTEHQSLYLEMESCNLITGSWNSDLFVKDTYKAREIVSKYNVDGKDVCRAFTDCDGEDTLMLRGYNSPFWNKQDIDKT